VRLALLGELMHLAMREIHPLFVVEAGERHAGRRVADQAVVLDRGGQDEREDAVDLPSGRCRSLARKFRDPSLY
jgi:hypothetical protein